MKVTQAQCDEWAASGQALRAAVAWRQMRGQLHVLSMMSNVPEATLEAFVESGDIDDMSRRALEILQ